VQPAQGKKRSSGDIAADIQSGEITSMKQIADVDPMAIVRYGRGYQQLLSLRVTPRVAGARVEYIWGPSGSGKTLKMYRDLMNLPNWKYGDPMADGFHDRVYIKTPTARSSGTDWFTGLTPDHDIIVFEEFSDHSGTPTFFTSLINPGPCRLPVFGGMVECRATKIFLLSNSNPEVLWTGAAAETRAAIMRRLKDPNVGTITFWGYGPNHDLAFCPCPNKEECPFVHDPSGPVAIAVGAKLPPPGGYQFKPPV